MGHFQLFSMILTFSMGHFLSFYTDFDGPFSKLMGLWRMAPCLPNHWAAYPQILHHAFEVNGACLCVPVSVLLYVGEATGFEYSQMVPFKLYG